MQMGRHWNAEYLSEGHLMDETFTWGPHSKMQLQPNLEDGAA